MSNNEQEQLREIAQHKTRSAATALGLLNYLTSKDTTIINDDDSTSTSRVYYGNTESNSVDEIETSLFSINPNPANESIALSYTLPADCNIAELQVYDLTGRVIKKYNLHLNENYLLIDTRSFANEVYFVKLMSNGKMIDKQKLIIQH